MQELLPCPFCGKTDEVWLSPPCNDAPDEDLTLNSWQVICRRCGFISLDFDDTMKATEAWNRRGGELRILDEAMAWLEMERGAIGIGLFPDQPPNEGSIVAHKIWGHALKALARIRAKYDPVPMCANCDKGYMFYYPGQRSECAACGATITIKHNGA